MSQGERDLSDHRTWLEGQLALQGKQVATACRRGLSEALVAEAKTLDRQVYFEIDQALEGGDQGMGSGWDIGAFKRLYLDLGFTPYQVTQYIVQRIAFYNDTLRAITQLSPNVFKEALALGAPRPEVWDSEPLWGIPLVVKDNIATGPDMPNTAGAYALLHATTKRPSTLVQKLKAAGALVVGKANLSEWANFMTLNSSNGYSALGARRSIPTAPSMWEALAQGLVLQLQQN